MPTHRYCLGRAEVLALLRETEPEALGSLWAAADRVRKFHMGEEVHLRGLVEISNHCVRGCTYCGINAGNRAVTRYRMTREEVLDCARTAARLAYGTVVLQAGEDYGLTRDWVADLVAQIKRETHLAVTLSLGERSDEDLLAWKRAGADRYLLRFETSDPELYARVHPGLDGRPSDRLAILNRLRRIGFEVGSGVMVGLPGQSYTSLAEDLLTFQRLDLDMIGVGPVIPHPATPLGSASSESSPDPDQVSNDEDTTLKVMALARLLCPEANIPSTTALATLDRAQGRELGLSRGANVVMPNLTPVQYRRLYEIYPGKACIHETAEVCSGCITARIHALGRTVGTGPGGRGERRSQLGDSA